MSLNLSRYRKMDAAALWHPYTRRSACEQGLPMIVRGKGARLFDAEGRPYIDAISSWWCCNLGHGHPRVVEAIRRQAGALQQSILGNLAHPRAVELAFQVCRLFPTPRHVLFASDGSSAVEAALKIAAQYWHNRGRPERSRFASLEHAYHGDTVAAVSVGYVKAFHAPFASILLPVYRAASPCCGRCPEGNAPEICRTECFESMRKLVERHARRLAAVIVEPLCQCAGGMRIYKPDYLRRLERLCRNHDVLLIVDEIATGFGRTGKMFAFEHAGIDPDIVCLGKGLSAGYLPISATVVKDSIYDTFADRDVDRTLYHGHTFCGNPIAAAAALETLAVYRADGILAEAARKGRLLAKALAECRGLPGVADVRCLGMIGVVELEARRAAQAQAVRRKLLERGILLRPLGSVLYLMPPLVTPDGMLAALANALGRAIRETAGRTG